MFTHSLHSLIFMRYLIHPMGYALNIRYCVVYAALSLSPIQIKCNISAHSLTIESIDCESTIQFQTNINKQTKSYIPPWHPDGRPSLDHPDGQTSTINHSLIITGSNNYGPTILPRGDITSPTASLASATPTTQGRGRPKGSASAKSKAKAAKSALNNTALSSQPTITLSLPNSSSSSSSVIPASASAHQVRMLNFHYNFQLYWCCAFTSILCHAKQLYLSCSFFFSYSFFLSILLSVIRLIHFIS